MKSFRVGLCLVAMMGMATVAQNQEQRPQGGLGAQAGGEQRPPVIPRVPRDRIEVIQANAYWRMGDQEDRWFDDGDFPRAIQLLRLHLDMFPMDYDVATNLGWLLESTEQASEAVIIYKRFLELNPNDPDGALPLAQYYMLKSREYDKIPPLLEPAIKMTPPPHSNVFRILANAYDRTGKFEDSLRVWEALLKVDPSDETAKRNRDRVKAKIGG